MVVVVMGVSGCGKTTIGRRVALRLQVPFYDGDDFHPEVNIELMKAGIPLNDEQRRPWLETLAVKIKAWNLSGGAVLACSALKASYREILRSKEPDAVRFVFLRGSKNLIARRMRQRSGHFMQVQLLDSQFASLEPPEDAFVVSIDRGPEEIESEIVKALKECDAAV